jgi:hypothetical protein
MRIANRLTARAEGEVVVLAPRLVPGERRQRRADPGVAPAVQALARARLARGDGRAAEAAYREALDVDRRMLVPGARETAAVQGALDAAGVGAGTRSSAASGRDGAVPGSKPRDAPARRAARGGGGVAVAAPVPEREVQ